MIYYYKQSSVYELDVALPKDKGTFADAFSFSHEDVELADFLKGKFRSITKKKGRKLCLEIADWCDGHKIRRICFEGGRLGRGTLGVEIEVGKHRDWEKHNYRPYVEKEDILIEKLGDGVSMRLCEGEHAF